MKISRHAVAQGVVWTVGAYGLTQLVRFATSVALTRLLAPDLFGMMVIVNSLRTGFDLLLDVGIGQNVIQNRLGENPSFYTTAWSIQIVRGLIIWLICLVGSVPLAHLYEVPQLIAILPIAGLYFLFSGFNSMAPFILRRRLQLTKLSVFEVVLVLISSLTQLVVAYIFPNIWSLVFGGLFDAALWMAGSYFLLPNLKYRLHFSRRHAKKILGFGKWIFFSSIVYFLSMNFDRLSLGKLVPLELLGVYGIARSVTDVVTSLFVRLSSFIVFPLIASHAETPRSVLRKSVARARFWLLLSIAFGISFLSAWSDLIIGVIFDARYQTAGHLLPILSLGVWFSIVSSINESTLLGLGKPLYGAAANGSKLLYLIICFPLSFGFLGIVGVAAVIGLGDLLRYPAIFAGQLKERFSFGIQDLLLTIVLIVFVGCWQFLRWNAGLGTSFDGLIALVPAQ